MKKKELKFSVVTMITLECAMITLECAMIT
jgi:hypothetical protein